jgi:cholesterol transport system auxiliary component
MNACTFNGWPPHIARWRSALLQCAVFAIAAGCANLKPPEAENISTYVLDARPALQARSQSQQRNAVLAVSAIRAMAGFDTPRMAYATQPYELDYFAKSQWADAPARMLSALIVRAIDESGDFRAVVHNPGVVTADLRLDTELVRLQHEFLGQPSRVRITLRAHLIDLNDRRVIAGREFEEVEPAAADTAYAGVAATNRALERMLIRLVEFCANPGANR